MQIVPVNRVDQFEAVEKLAYKIIPDHYKPYIPVKNILYFLEKFQAAKAIKQQIDEEGFEYYLLTDETIYTGYLGIQVAGNVLNLSKLYILKQYRGKGIGDLAISFVDERAAKAKVSLIELIVNKYNYETISFYEKRGYSIIESFVHNYDNVYTVEEHKMIKQLNK
jgi:ribosomal protein S18 acetylase RimI-like enzyme